MELMYRYVLYIGIFASALFLLLAILKKKKAKEYTKGIKLANTYVIDKDPYYRRKIRQFKVLSFLVMVSVICSLIFTSVLCARPYKRELHQEDKYCRDIILCLDISTSVDEVNKKLVKELISTVERLKNERFGIVIFNTSPVLLSPLTDDYEYIIECLENVEKALDVRIKTSNNPFYYPSDYYYWDAYISDGTLVGNTERGSSLIGDGLAATVNNFSTKDVDRTKIVIFATDNDPYGDCIIDLPEAAKICRDRGITVYGIGTRDMTSANLNEMKTCVEMTGGEFFVEGKSGTFDSIVDKVESHSENLVKGPTIVTDVDYPKKAFVVMLISLFSMFIIMRLLKE